MGNKCFSGDCIYRMQGKSSVHCSYPDAVYYQDIKKPCHSCGRNPNQKKGGCGACLGRGAYIYPYAYESCDCGGYKKR